MREVRVDEREADLARVSSRAERVEAELEAQREALRDAEEAVARERAVIQRRAAEIEERQDQTRQERDRAVAEVAEAGGKKGCSVAAAARQWRCLHAQLREKEIELELQERRLSELSTALQRREADLNTYARKLQTSAP